MYKYLIIILLFIFASVNLFSQNTKNCVLLNTKQYNQDDSICFAEAYENYRFFIMGEYHFNKENNELFPMVFKNLYHNANVRIIFMENGFANSIIANHFMKTGNPKSLNLITSTNQFDKQMYKELKVFYDSLPINDKFRFIGVDLEIYESANKFIHAAEILFGDNEIPDSIYELFNNFQNDASTKNIDIAQKTFDNIYFDWKNSKEKYITLLDENYTDYVKLLKRIKESYRFHFYNYNYGRDSLKQTRRERFIYNNISEEVKNYPDYNFFGQFGLAHIGLERFLIVNEKNGFQSFCTKLNTNPKSPLKNNVCSIAIIYFDNNIYASKIYQHYSSLIYYISRKKYLPNKIYKAIKENTTPNKTYVTNISKNCNSLLKKTNRNFQYLIYKR